jgi:uncharacterized membrane protein (Fun14 family)
MFMANADNLAAIAGDLFLCGFTAPNSFTSTKGAIFVGTAGAGGVHGFLALYTVDSANNCTLVAVTADTPTAFQTTGIVSLNWITPVNVVAGTRYAIGVLANSSTAPVFPVNLATIGVIPLVAPFIIAFTGGGTLVAIPATIAAGSLTAFTETPYFEVLM